MDLNKDIKTELDKLNTVESKITNEIIKLDETTAINEDNNQVPFLCKEWFSQKERVIKKSMKEQ